MNASAGLPGNQCGHARRFQPALRAGDRVYGPYRVCEVCSTGLVLQVAPPAGHPDTEAVSFSPDAEKFLAAVDAELSALERAL